MKTKMNARVLIVLMVLGLALIPFLIGGVTAPENISYRQIWRIDTVSDYGDTISLSSLGFRERLRFTFTPDVNAYISYTGNYTSTTTIPVRAGETFTLPEWFDPRINTKLYIKTIDATPDTIRTQLYGN